MSSPILTLEAGGGYTWAANSGENRLTPWSNDPVSDRPGEVVYLRDEETAAIWSPTPLPCGVAGHEVRHGAGYSCFTSSSYDLHQKLSVYVAPDAPVKIVRLRLVNQSARPRRLTATYYVEWVLGVMREQEAQFIIPDYDAGSQALLARNPWHPEFGERVAFAAASKRLHGLTANRSEFLGRMGSYSRPAAMTLIGLSGEVQPGCDPCAALQVHIDLPAGGSEEVWFLLGQGAERAEAVALVERFQQLEAIDAAWEATGALWDQLLGSVQVRTPDPAMDLLLNRWLLYQSLACRIWGRSAVYQSSGAYGFRDQLQDVMAMVHTRPELVRGQVLQAAGRQFEAGDVLHWWHPPSGRGVRTRCSDDLLWLPYVTAHYIEATGDMAILEEQIPFLSAPPLTNGEEDRYGEYPSTGTAASLFEHCRRAIQRGATSGAHGLPLMGSGDWNDGMNRVGREGRGESVWLGWFLHSTLTRFAGICVRRGDGEQAAAYRQRAAELALALEQYAWDGGWYLRAFYDDGSPLGSARDRECRIDAIAQSWAVLSGAGDPVRGRQAMQAVLEHLVRPDEKLALLFTPPFDKTRRDPGYIKGYVPGIRENGGQYTHGATWTAWAFAALGEADTAESLFRMLNPIYHGESPAKVDTYKVEPYVVAADIYGAAPHTGRGGWTWYTGSAAWLYRLGLEGLLGIRRQGDALRIDPQLPAHWPGFAVDYRFGTSIYHIDVRRTAITDGAGLRTLDGVALDGPLLPLTDDGFEHLVKVTI